MERRLLNLDPDYFGPECHALCEPWCKIETSLTLTADACREIIGLVVRLNHRLDEEFLRAFPNLRFIATITTGLNHIDKLYCDTHDIKVLALTGETAFLETIRSTPELTWGLLIALSRQIPAAFEHVKNGGWRRTMTYGSELSGKTLGIIGFGRIGKILGRYAHAFGMPVVYHDHNQPQQVEYPAEALSLEDLLAQADVVSINLPLTEDTWHYLRAEHFALMKPTAWFLNTARGELVDGAALLSALEEVTIAGAAVDVIEGETSRDFPNSTHPLVAFSKTSKRLIITPHIGGSTVEAMTRTAHFMAKKVANYLRDHLSN